MVEILRKGELPSEKEYSCTCHNCKTVFKFKAKEGRRRIDQRDGDYLSIPCPLEGCGKDCTISVSAYIKPNTWHR